MSQTHTQRLVVLPEDAGPHYISLCRTLRRQRKRRVRDLVWTNIQLAAVFILACSTAIATSEYELNHIGVLGYITFTVAITVLGAQAAYQGHLIRHIDEQLEEMACHEKVDD